MLGRRRRRREEETAEADPLSLWSDYRPCQEPCLTSRPARTSVETCRSRERRSEIVGPLSALSASPSTVESTSDLYIRSYLCPVSTEMISHVFESFATAAGVTLHVDSIRGVNNHHMCVALSPLRPLCAPIRLRCLLLTSPMSPVLFLLQC